MEGNRKILSASVDITAIFLISLSSFFGATPLLSDRIREKVDTILMWKIAQRTTQYDCQSQI